MVSQIVCQVCQLLMPAVPPGSLTECPHCLSVYRVDEMHELCLLEDPKRNPFEESPVRSTQSEVA
jgi:hypothetical protein